MDTEVKTTVDEEEVETVATDDEATAEEEENEGTLAEASADDEGENISDEDLDTFLERYNASREQNGEDEAEEEAAAEQQGDAETETAGEEDPDISASLAADLAAIKAKYPDCAPDSMDQITDLTEFIRLRVRGMSAEDAFAKVDAEKIERVKKLQKAANADGKKHLTPTGTSARRADPPGEIPAALYRTMRDMYPNESKENLQKIYRRVSG